MFTTIAISTWWTSLLSTNIQGKSAEKVNLNWNLDFFTFTKVTQHTKKNFTYLNHFRFANSSSTLQHFPHPHAHSRRRVQDDCERYQFSWNDKRQTSDDISWNNFHMYEIHHFARSLSTVSTVDDDIAELRFLSSRLYMQSGKWCEDSKRNSKIKNIIHKTFSL